MMTIKGTDNTIIEGYFKLLNTLSIDYKLDLISKLTASVKVDLTGKKNSFEESFGAFDSKESAEEIIAEIRDSRNFSRQNEEL